MKLLAASFKELTSKLASTRSNEFLNAKSERDLKIQGKVVDADEMLRPKLKLYALASKRLSLSSLTKGASQLKASHHVILLVTA